MYLVYFISYFEMAVKDEKERRIFLLAEGGEGAGTPLSQGWVCAQGPCCCFMSQSKSSVGSRRKWVRKVVSSCVSSSSPWAAVLGPVGEVLGVGPRGARAWDGTRGSAGVGAPWDAAVTPHNLTQGSRRGAEREGEDPSSCPARILLVVHSPHELWPRRTGSSLPPSVHLHISTCLLESTLQHRS